MQNTKFRTFLIASSNQLNSFISDSWRKRSVLILSLLCGFYLTNSSISFLLDRSINVVLIPIIIILIMELSIRTLFLSKTSKIYLLNQIINYFRIGSTYALILEAFKLGS